MVSGDDPSMPQVRMQPLYDHSYYFISTFMREHVDFHARALGLRPRL